MAKNITLAIDEGLLDKVRVLAAIRRTSVNAMVREFLVREVERESSDAARMELWNERFKSADETAGDRVLRSADAGSGFDGQVYRRGGWA